jgi:hypothetical protein
MRIVRVLALPWPALFIALTAAAEPIVYDGFDGPGNGKHVVILAGDDEYRSEESMPQLGKILAVRHGFKVTMLWAINKDTGAIDPATQDNIPGLEALETADLMIMFLRFRELPDDQMKYIMDYTNSGRPILALRTSTHPFFFQQRKDSPYAKWSWNSSDPPGGYGREVLGETWVNHHGRHNVEATRGLIAHGQGSNPIVRGCEDVFGPSDVYGIRTLTGDSTPLLMGLILSGLNPDDPPTLGKELMPIAWIKSYTGTEGKASRIFTTTMGHSYDLKSEGFRRLLVNAAYWCIDIEDQIPERANVEYVGEYDPSDIGFGTHKVGVMPAEHAL